MLGVSISQAAQGRCSQQEPCFGMAFAGSPFPPQDQHDRSTNAKDNIVPRSLVISQGSSVTYRVNGNHWPAVYRPGIDDEDISATSFPAPSCAAGTRVNDPNGRLFETAGCLSDGSTFTIPASTFSAPGRYLIICQVRPHFLNDMYGWIVVK
jgi:hypothetical protein